MSKTLTMTPKIADLKSAWLEAKKNEAGWTEHRRGLEEQLREELTDQFAVILDELDQTASLTTTVQIGDDFTAKLGYSLDISQVDILQFVSNHPQLLGVVFKQKYEPDARVVLKTLNGGGPLGEELDGIVNFKPLTPSFAKK
jgi:hypothetical protein